VSGTHVAKSVTNAMIASMDQVMMVAGVESLVVNQKNEGVASYSKT
jgi:hypothetical protein